MMAWAAVLFTALVVAQPPTLEAVLERGTEYVKAYYREFRLVTAEESCVQIRRPFGSTETDHMAVGAPLGQPATPTIRKLRAEFALIAPPGAGTWMAYRDVYELDGGRLHEQRDRLARALADPSGGGKEEARRLSDESLKHNVGRAVRDVNVPTFPLIVLLPANRSGFSFTKKGEKRVGDLTAWVVEYVETGRPPLSRTADGVPKPSRGELWIDPATGRVVKSRLVFDTLDAYPDMRLRPERYLDFPRTTFEVTYKPDAGLNMWVPVEMKETYDSRVEILLCTSTYTGFRRFDSTIR